MSCLRHENGNLKKKVKSKADSMRLKKKNQIITFREKRILSCQFLNLRQCGVLSPLSR
jgi:hypothetical protein